ncbi:hypothetical protein Godav_011616 [Gossypium davidsonii]|uniref:Uncharacterized protein n=1 Tax=Gossypium davidsonii TaxID=34287 RepID=A0A7J8RAI1_GOSDV|nr:hypothetical protein [Gossypium davidsonii]
MIFNMPLRMPPRNSFEIGSIGTTFKRTARASVFSILITFKTNLQGIDNS